LGSGTCSEQCVCVGGASWVLNVCLGRSNSRRSRGQGRNLKVTRSDQVPGRAWGWRRDQGLVLHKGLFSFSTDVFGFLLQGYLPTRVLAGLARWTRSGRLVGRAWQGFGVGEPCWIQRGSESGPGCPELGRLNSRAWRVVGTCFAAPVATGAGVRGSSWGSSSGPGSTGKFLVRTACPLPHW
jgi:hypothetical protein